jgi:2-oxo-3-hexenedioate decarboxylase
MNVDVLVREFEKARATGTLVTPPSRRFPDFSLAQAYIVGSGLAKARTAHGRRIVGQKIAFTNESIWADFDLDYPVWAPIYDDGIQHASSIRLGRLVAPRLELEIMLHFGSPVTTNASIGDVAAAVKWAALGFEIVDCHYRNWMGYTAPDLVADYGFHSSLVIGPPSALEPRQVVELSDVGVRLRTGGTVVAEGSALSALGGPVRAVHRLLTSPNHPGIAAGDTVASGTLSGPATPITPGEIWAAEAFGPITLAPISVGFQ